MPLFSSPENPWMTNPTRGYISTPLFKPVEALPPLFWPLSLFSLSEILKREIERGAKPPKQKRGEKRPTRGIKRPTRGDFKKPVRAFCLQPCGVAGC
jgi:hypothetical protein